MSRSRLLLIVVAAILAALTPMPALAAPPSLIWFMQTEGRWSASWYLPPGVQTQEIELSTRPHVAADGSFFTEFVQYRNVLGPHIAVRVTHISDQKLKPGTYYFHVSGADKACLATGECPQREWSNVLTLVIAKPHSKHGPAGRSASPPLYKNCTNFNKRYPHGVGRRNARDDSDDPVTNFKRNTRIYRIAMSHNKGLDRDKDGIACEKR